MIRTASLAERADLVSTFDDFPHSWPSWVLRNQNAPLVYADLDSHRDFVLVAYDDEQPDRVLACGVSVPLHSWEWDEGKLPRHGWDSVVRSAALTRLRASRPNVVSALEVTVRRSAQGTGLSALMLQAMKDNARRAGFIDLIAPVRPSDLHQTGGVSIAAHVRLMNADGLPRDRWLRTHIRTGGRIVEPIQSSFIVSDPLDRWREATGLPFDRSGPVPVPGGLVPVICDVENDVAVYVEPGVWVHHDLRPSARPADPVC